MRRIILTEDGSSSLYVPALNEHYHSIHGAVQESMHIFIRAGIYSYLQQFAGKTSLKILEAGFGTGLNAFLTLIFSEKEKIPVYYHTVEKYPLTEEEYHLLNYTTEIPFARQELFEELHRCTWEEQHELSQFFRFYKQKEDFRNLVLSQKYDIIYFDAFNPDVQPHLWSTEVLRRFYETLVPGGILVTYCVKGIVKRALREVGFTLERLPGPPGKREMLRASKSHPE